jgi:tetratricopeptide (TPR) repeat protein
MTQGTFQSAIQLHQAGRLDEAETAYRQTLASEPANSDAIQLLGVIFAQRGQLGQAEIWIRQAIALRPDSPEYYLNLGQAMAQGQQLAQAIACFRQVAAMQPGNHPALFRLGMLLAKQSDLMSAVEAIKTALNLEPANVEYRGALASVFMQASRPDLAAIELREGVKRRPEDARFWHNLGSALSEAGQVDEALSVFEQTLKLNPRLAIAHCNRAAALRQVGRHNEAMAAIRQAIEIDPTCPGAQTNFGALLCDQGKWEQALDAWHLAVAQEPNVPGTHWNLARILLRLGHFAEGWEEFEWRLRFPGMRLKRGFLQPQWDGSNPAGKTILLHTEGGFGDAIQFIRLVPQVTTRGGNWLLECQPELVSLFADTVGIDRIIPRGEKLPDFDMQIPLQSLPRILGIRVETIPNKVPYLKPPPDRVEYWANRIKRDDKPRVGLVWAGSSGAKGDERTRSIELFSPLAAIPNVRFFSLQKGSESEQTPPAGMDWTDYTPELGDLADAAAFVQNLDLMITVDTSAAHLAGALARPVWVLVPFRSDFRWLGNRVDSPWYPTMRLFREPALGDSATPIAEMVQALREFKRC